MTGPAGKLPIFQIHPTRRCNLKCLHCYSTSGPDVSEALDVNLVLQGVADAAELGYRVLSVSGGEPMLYRPLEQVLRGAHACGLFTTVTTNGMLLDARRVGMLEQHADLVAISLDGVPEAHAEMRGSPRAYADMVRHLPNLRRSGIPFGFIFTLTFHNVDELDWVARFAIDQGAGLLQIHPLEPVGRAHDLLSESVPDLQENEYALLEASRLRDQYGDQIQIQLDLATWPAIHDHPEKVFAHDGSPRPDALLAELVAPLVLQADGVVAPLQYGFPRPWCLGNLKDARLHNLAKAWVSSHYGPFRALCRDVRDDVLRRPAVPIVNWYSLVHEAAVLKEPQLVSLTASTMRSRSYGLPTMP